MEEKKNGSMGVWEYGGVGVGKETIHHSPLTTHPSPLEPYLAQFERFERGLGSNDPAWLRTVRETAIHRFAELGFPTTRQEEWRFTPLHPILETSFRLADGTAPLLTTHCLRRFTFEDLACTQLVFINGRYVPELSRLRHLPKDTQAGSLAEVLATDPAWVDPYLSRCARYEDHPFTALNTAFLSDGAFVYIPSGAILKEPIHLLFISTAPDEAIVSYPRVLIVAGSHSQAAFLESYAGLENACYFTNAVTEIVVGENAIVDHYKLQRESMEAFHMANMAVHLERGSVFSSHSIALGGALVRNEVYARLDGEGIDCTLNGLYLVDGQRLVDNHTTIDHAKPHCNSHEVYKGILRERGRGVFNGKIFVRPNAQKTDAKQTNQTLLLSDDAQINTKPQLEIFADDVKCTHGATVGQLDEDALFYMRSRGIGLEEARSLLIYAFASDIVSRIKIEPVRAQLDQFLLADLPKPPKLEEVPL